MNILILSAGTRNSIVRYFKETIKDDGIVVATDMSPLAPAIYAADKYYIVPKITENGYIDEIFKICKKEKIGGVLSLIDPELSLLAKYRKEFKNLGIAIIGSDYDICEMSLDKMRMYEFCKENGFRTVRSWCDFEKFRADVIGGEVKFPVFIKPRFGSASIDGYKLDDIQTAELVYNHSKKHDKWIIQEYMEGEEFGADVYVDMISGKTVSVFTKKKILMRAGETDKSISFKDEKLFELLKAFVEKVGYRGPLDIDGFNAGGKYYILEVNPRFGGGYPHAYECGVNFMRMICNNLEKKENADETGNYKDGVYMMKYSEISIM